MKLQELQELLYSLLEEISSVFDVLKIEYCLGYGTLLGAIRHQGIIPWDDDIDLFVPRTDYEKLLVNYNRTALKSFVFSIETCKDYHLPFAKIALKGTKSNKPQPNWPLDMGVSIDIFPLDGLPSSLIPKEVHYFRMKLVNRCIGTHHYQFCDLSAKSKMIWLISHLVGFERLLKMSKNLYNKYSFEDSSICGNVVWGSYHHNDIFEKSLLGRYRLAQFDNMQLPVPQFSEELLTLWYGDYLRIPSKEEIEKFSHNFADLYERCKD